MKKPLVNRLVSPVIKEFQIAKCGFEHLPPDDFVKSQWQSRTKSLAYLVYRYFIALFFLGIVITTFINDFNHGLYFIYLTHWGIDLCLITTALDATLVSLWYFHPEFSDRVSDADSMPVAFKIYWILHNNTLALSLVISIVYWTILFNGQIGNGVTIFSHGFNSILMFTDLWIVAYPVRLLHVGWALLMGSLYTVFSVIYYYAGGVDPFGNHFIYPVLDWSKPVEAAVTSIGSILLLIVVYFFLFLIYRIRLFLHRRFKSRTLILPVTPVKEVQSVRSDSMPEAVPTTGISMVLGSYENPTFTISSEKISN